MSTAPDRGSPPADRPARPVPFVIGSPGRASRARHGARPTVVVSGLGADALVVRVRGRLDGELGADLLDLVDAGFEAASEVKLDLQCVAAYTDDGLAALAACTSRGARISPRSAGAS